MPRWKSPGRTDGRRYEARRLRDLTRQYLGDGELSQAEVTIARHMAALELKAELLRRDLAAGKDVDVSALVSVSAEMRAGLDLLREARGRAAA